MPQSVELTQCTPLECEKEEGAGGLGVLPTLSTTAMRKEYGRCFST